MRPCEIVTIRFAFDIHDIKENRYNMAESFKIMFRDFEDFVYFALYIKPYYKICIKQYGFLDEKYYIGYDTDFWGNKLYKQTGIKSIVSSEKYIPESVLFINISTKYSNLTEVCEKVRDYIFYIYYKKYVDQDK